jgi:hypothetical protein
MSLIGQLRTQLFRDIVAATNQIPVVEERLLQAERMLAVH